MVSTPSPKTKVYLLEQRKNQELNIEHIDEEMRLEQVRQAASKMEWTSFGQAVRRNLLEKRNTIDADGRIDVLNGIAYMKTKMPIEENNLMEEKIRVMAESLGCLHKQTSRGWSINRQEDLIMDFTVNDGEVTTVVLSFWEEPSFYSPEATRMLQLGMWTELRNRISDMLLTYDKLLSRDDRRNCMGAMRMLEMLFGHFSQDPSYTSIHRSNYGFYLPRNDLRAGRVYYLAEPHFRNIRSKDHIFQLQKDDHEVLPYFEFSFAKHDSPCTLPEFDTKGWAESIEANAVICMKLSRGFNLTETTRKKLGAISAKTPSVKHFTNSYRYVTGAVKIENNLQMITQFGDGQTQHFYNVDVNQLRNDGDSVITEIYLKHLQDFHEIIAILRNEAMHISLWESMISACYEKQGMKKHTVAAIKMDVFLTREQIVITFDTKFAPVKVVIQDSGVCEAKVNVVHAQTGLQIAEKIDETLSRKLNETWSIPNMLTYAVSGSDCNLAKIKVPLRSENPETVGPIPTYAAGRSF
ncbi:Mediator of RNA polymerase II transcription subunit 1.2 [Caenorhabditis elegans]|uniref:Mediator of RNA polymerase II transcription subunit 1.2 n=1 Tax=Caenorhabditis elegans TaxID=6239 RepID=MED1L_CAEEL|nr:Mediator of RNA polymerase II transcription subunit 1.2 [Caenorhabditis elegans]O02042.1 RecName: Full=Mediator of RNA polymerase II transcription subunit 1.2; AltName: Full=Mediator complex subunit 1.2 [Caenorhabditis elegans]CCD61703.1 Mediator of RNA polymerase II transcription subunit 1.2 [Caenorhabditis elegans]|eukprot:NP_510778.1 Mediator of RNA polymerase II transcription subunit 1.2 [Caenorhabditis elegans]